MSADREDRLRAHDWQGQRFRHPAPGTPQHQRTGAGAADHRVVNPPGDVAVVQQHQIDELTQSRHRLAVATAQWLLGSVAGCHDKRRRRRIAHELDVEGGGRKHDAEVVETRCDGVRDGRSGTAWRQHDGRP